MRLRQGERYTLADPVRPWFMTRTRGKKTRTCLRGSGSNVQEERRVYKGYYMDLLMVRANLGSASLPLLKSVSVTANLNSISLTVVATETP